MVSFNSGLLAQGKQNSALFPWLAKSKKMGYCDVNGKLVIEPMFEVANPFVNGYAVVGDKNNYGVIDEFGKIIVPVQYSNIELQKKGRFTLLIQKKEYNSWMRFWNWKILPDFNVLSTNSSGPFLATKVPRAVWTIKHLPDQKILFNGNRSDAEGGKYWKNSWSPTSGIPDDINISSAGNILMVGNNLYQLGTDQKLKKIANNVFDIIDSNAVITFEKNAYFKSSLTEGKIENYIAIDSIMVSVGSNKTIEIKKRNAGVYPFATITTDLFKDKTGKTYFFPDLEKPFPTNIADYKTSNETVSAEEIMAKAFVVASIPDSKYFLVVSAFGKRPTNSALLLDGDGKWNTNIPVYEGFEKMLPNGEMFFTRAEKKGILNNTLDFKILPFDREAYPINFSPIMFIGKDAASKKYGIYNVLSEKWQIMHLYNFLTTTIEAGVAVYSLEESRTKNEKYGLLNIKNHSQITAAIYDKITADGYAYKTENEQQIKFYINLNTGKEYREQ